MKPYPLKFEPVYKERIWGGRRLEALFGKKLPGDVVIGESWELSDLPGDETIIKNGPLAGRTLSDFLKSYGKDYGFVDKVAANSFPLLIKLLDARDILSVQVHPDNRACQMFSGARLKTECWYVLHAEPDAVIYRGLKPGTNRQKVETAIWNGSLEDVMEKYPARKGDFHFLPAGTIHALGAGIMIAEIQTPSDTTYRLYDWNRVDKQGRSRELHIEQSLESIHYTDGTAPPPEPEFIGSATLEFLMQLGSQSGNAKRLVDCRFFSVVHTAVSQARELVIEGDYPFIFMSLAGRGDIIIDDNTDTACAFNKGETLLLPKTVRLKLTYHDAGEVLLSCLGPESAVSG